MRVAELAFEYRAGSSTSDVVIDMVCYRRRGHNEGDDPSMTQPLMYNLIEAKRSVRKLYTESLIGRGDITVEEAEQALRDYQGQLERVFTETREAASAARRTEAGTGLERRSRRPRTPAARRGDRRRPPEVIKRIADAHVRPPEGFTVHPKLMPLLQRARGDGPEGGIDWAHGRAARVRLAAARGHARSGSPARTAAAARSCQRHAVLTTARPAPSGRRCPTSTTDQAQFWVYDSPALGVRGAWASSTATRVARPDALVLWEAQFGDFVNGAQTIIDEFISSAEQKWGQRSVRRAAAAARLRGPGARPLVAPASSGSCSCAPRTT